jgi:hypothetical protein
MEHAMPETIRKERILDGRALLGLRVALLALALLAGAYVSEGVLEAWQATSQSQAAK